MAGGGGLAGISCPVVSLCVAVDGAGNVVTSVDPTGPASAWTVSRVATGAELAAVSCASASLCVAAGGGVVLTSTRPTGGPGAWTVGHLNLSANAVSCRSASLCVAVGSAGRAVISTDPTGGTAAWTPVQVPTSVPAECGKNGPGMDCQADLEGVSCPSVSLCVAVDSADNSVGDVITSTQPSGGPSAWNVDPIDRANGLIGVSCPSVSLCVAVDFAGRVFTSTNPTRGASAWKQTNVNTGGFGAAFHVPEVACGSVALCVETAGGGVVSSTNPAGGPPAWTATDVDNSSRGLNAVSCVSNRLCAAVDGVGNVVLGVPAQAPTLAQIRALIGSELKPVGPGAKIAALLNHNGFSESITAPSAGRLVVSWYYLPSGAHLATAKPKPVLIAGGRATFATAGSTKIEIRPTRDGTRLLKRSGRVKLTATGVFTPTGSRPITTLKPFTLTS